MSLKTTVSFLVTERSLTIRSLRTVGDVRLNLDDHAKSLPLLGHDSASMNLKIVLTDAFAQKLVAFIQRN